MLEIETAKAAAVEAAADVEALEARAAEIDRQLAAAAIERDDALAAIGRSIADGNPEKSRAALVTAETRAAANVRALELGREEVVTRLQHARGRHEGTQLYQIAAQERHDYATAAVALKQFSDSMLAALGDLRDAMPARHLSDAFDVIKTAIDRGPDPARVAPRLSEWVEHLRRRAGLVKAPPPVVITGPPHPFDTGAFLTKDMKFMNADGTGHELYAGTVANLPAAIVARLVDMKAGQALGARPGFCNVRMLADAIDDERHYSAGALVSVVEAKAAGMIERGVARLSLELTPADIQHWDRQRGVTLPHAGRGLFVSTIPNEPPVDLGRLPPIDSLKMEAA